MVFPFFYGLPLCAQKQIKSKAIHGNAARPVEINNSLYLGANV
jgi:hypothetical protein